MNKTSNAVNIIGRDNNNSSANSTSDKRSSLPPIKRQNKRRKIISETRTTHSSVNFRINHMRRLIHQILSWALQMETKTWHKQTKAQTSDRLKVKLNTMLWLHCGKSAMEAIPSLMKFIVIFHAKLIICSTIEFEQVPTSIECCNNNILQLKTCWPFWMCCRFALNFVFKLLRVKKCYMLKIHQ